MIHPDAAIRPTLEARGALWHGLPHLGAWDMIAATRLRLKSWKTQGQGGGSGLLGNFVCHCLYYLEWFCGSISGLGGRIFLLPDEEAQGSIALGLIQVYRALGGGWEIRINGCEAKELPLPAAPQATKTGTPAAPEAELPAPRPVAPPAAGPQAAGPALPEEEPVAVRFGLPLGK